MLRGHRVLAPAVANSFLLRSQCAAAPNAVRHGGQQRLMTDKILVGGFSALTTCTTTLGLFHLIVTPVSGTIAVATLATAFGSGALCIIDGGKESAGSTFGAVVGIFIGAMGGFYAKSQKEPWRK